MVASHGSAAPTPTHRRRNLGALAVLTGLVVAAAILLLVCDVGRGGNDDKFQTSPMGDLVLDSVAIAQEGEVHEVAPGKFRDEVEDLALEPGSAAAIIRYTNEDGEPAAGATITYTDEQGNEHEVTLDDDGVGLVPLNLTLGEDGAARLNSLRLAVGNDEREVKLNVVASINNGLTGGDMVNTPSELGVEPASEQPRTTVDLEVSSVFLQAFADFCGFSPDQVKTVSLEPNDKPRFQVAWDGSGFVQARSVIPVGQPIWVLISKEGDKCRINPPCGNPEVPQGKLPPVPPGKEVPPPSPTPTGVVPSATPPVETPPSGRTPTPTKTLPPGVTPPPTATRTPPRQDTPAPTNTPRVPPTSTPAAPKCQVTILGPHRVDNTDTHARMQASVQWDQRPNFSASINWYLDDTFIGGGESIQFMATLNVNHTLTLKVMNGGSLICQDEAVFAEGSIPPGDDGPGSPPISTETPVPAQPTGAPTPTPNDDGYKGP